MPSTRITIVLDVDHEPEIDLPQRAAHYLERALCSVEGLGAVEVIRGETDSVVWTPRRQDRRAS